MKIKTFPIQFIEEELNKINNKAKELKMTTKEFILEAIKEKMEKKEEK